jgi:hypothetical protein
MSQEGANLHMDIEGSPSSGGAGSTGMAGSRSGSSMPPSLVTIPPQNIQGRHDDDTPSSMATSIAIGLALVGTNGSSSVKLFLTYMDNTGALEPVRPLEIQADGSNA